MASQSSATVAPPSRGDDEPSRLHIRSIKELPAGHDAELATIFREMRRAADIPRERMAGRLATTIEIIDALESGAIFALPPWEELSRIVTAYAVMLGLDARPLLRRLEAQLSPDAGLAEVTSLKTEEKTPAPAPVFADPKPSQATSSAARPGGPPMPPSATSLKAEPAPPLPQAGPPPEVMTPPPPPHETHVPGEPAKQPHEESAASVVADKQAFQKRTAALLKPVLNWLVLIGFVAALGTGVWYAAQHPRMVWSALDTMPDPMPRVVRSAWKFMKPLEGNTTGQQISDPEGRKSDKLP